jgi:hypothetical protein
LSRRPNFPSWGWAGWKGRIEYNYWIKDWHLYRHLTEQGDQRPEKRWANKRRQCMGLHWLLEQETATIFSCPTIEDDSKPIRRISSFVARFRLPKVRPQGAKLRYRRRFRNIRKNRLLLPLASRTFTPLTRGR